MSTSKHIDVICIIALLCTLLLTAAFMNGKVLGLEPITDADAGDGYFTANDLAGDWDTAGATRITLSGDGGSVKGNGAYIHDGDVHIVYPGRYVLSGSLTDGSVIVDADGDDKIWIALDGASLHCEDSAAIIVEQAGKVFLTLVAGTENTVSGGADYSADAVSNKIDGVIYARDDLTINGSGALTVTAPYKHGIVCNDDLVIAGGKLVITAAKDGIHANDSACFTDADLTIRAGDDGITVSNDDETAYVYIASGKFSIPACYEGIEAIQITIAGGEIDIRPTDDGINANGRGSNSVIYITGGDITIINETGRDADGLDSNGSIYISGGNTFISVNTSSCALDYGTENGGVCKISGGTVVAAGGSTMAEGFDSDSEQAFIMYNTSANAGGTKVTLQNAAGETLVSETIPCGFSSLVLSTPALRLGETCTLSLGDSSVELTVDNSSATGSFGKGGMFGGGMQQNGGFGGRGGKMDHAFGGRPDAGNSEMPELPDGTTGASQLPQMPGGDFRGGGGQQRPDGEGFPDMQGPGDMQPPGDRNGDFPFDTSELPEDAQGIQGGKQRGENQSAQWGKPQDRTQDNANPETNPISPATLILAGVSLLVLLAGILIAVKVKH